MQDCDSYDERAAMAVGMCTEAVTAATKELISILNDLDWREIEEAREHICEFILWLAEQASDYYSISESDLAAAYPLGDAPNFPNIRTEIKEAVLQQLAAIADIRVPVRKELLERLAHFTVKKNANARLDPGCQVIHANPDASPPGAGGVRPETEISPLEILSRWTNEELASELKLSDPAIADSASGGQTVQDPYLDLLDRIVQKRHTTLEKWAKEHKFPRSTVFEWKRLRSAGSPLTGKMSKQKSAEIETGIDEDAKTLGLLTQTDTD